MWVVRPLEVHTELGLTAVFSPAKVEALELARSALADCFSVYEPGNGEIQYVKSLVSTLEEVSCA